MERGEPGPDGLPVVEFQAGGARPRIVGPGRKERRYQDRIQELDRELTAEARRGEALEGTLGELEGELDLLGIIERGSQRRLDRLEAQLDASRLELRASRRRAVHFEGLYLRLQHDNARLNCGDRRE